MLTAYLQCLSIFHMGDEMNLLHSPAHKGSMQSTQTYDINGIQLNSRHQMQRIVIQQPQTAEGAEE